MAPADSAPLSLPPSPAPANDGGWLLAGRYRLETLLGKGGMGEVWAATDTQLKRKVAVKLTQLRFADHPDFARRFVHETELAARLRHRNIPRIYTTETAPDGRLFMVMELVDGITLRRLIELQGKVPPVRMICYATFAVEALGYAHAVGVYHRDVKPENLMVGEGEASGWLLDFGIARGLVMEEGAAEEGAAEENAPRRSGKRRSTVLGTVGYVPPEVALGGVADHRGDLFQMGVTIYEAISGRKPFPVREDDKTGALSALVFDDPPPLPDEECPAGLWSILMRLLAKAPEDRYGAADELLAALVALLPQLRESVTAGPLRAQVLERDRQDRVVRKAFASAAPPSEPPASAPAAAVAQGGTEPLAGRPTLPLGSAFVVRGPAFREASAKIDEDARERRTAPMPPGLVRVSPAHPAAALGERRPREAPRAVVTAPLDVTASRAGRAWVEGPELMAPVQAEPMRPAGSAGVAPAMPSAASRGSPMTLVLILLAVSIAVLGMGIGMMVQARYGQRRADEGPAATASVVPAVTASAVPAVTASAVPVATVSAAPARTAARPEPVRRSPELVDPFSDRAKKAKPKLVF